jgi:hypothetical protein
MADGGPHDFQSGFSAFCQFVAAAMTGGAAADFCWQIVSASSNHVCIAAFEVRS